MGGHSRLSPNPVPGGWPDPKLHGYRQVWLGGGSHPIFPCAPKPSAGLSRLELPPGAGLGLGSPLLLSKSNFHIGLLQKSSLFSWLTLATAILTAFFLSVCCLFVFPRCVFLAGNNLGILTGPALKKQALCASPEHFRKGWGENPAARSRLETTPSHICHYSKAFRCFAEPQTSPARLRRVSGGKKK